MSNDYIIPDKEVALSDDTSIKSNVDSEIQENGGPIVSASKLYEILKSKGILNSIDLINDNSNSIKLLNDEIGELDSTSTGYKTIANRLTSLESNSGSGGDIYGFNKPKIEDFNNLQPINNSKVYDVKDKGINVINDSNKYQGFTIDIKNDKETIILCSLIPIVDTDNVCLGISDDTGLYPAWGIRTGNYQYFQVGRYTNESNWAGTAASYVATNTPYNFLKISIDKINKIAIFSKSWDSVNYWNMYTVQNNDYNSYITNNSKWIFRIKPNANSNLIPYIQIIEDIV